MTGDAGPRKSGARRPGSTILLALAVLLLLGGGTAVAVGVAGQDADPPAPSAAPTTGWSTPSASDDARSPEATSPGSVSAAGPTEVTAAESTPPAALPVSVDIPAIGVRSELITLGLNPDGTLAVPAPGPDYDKAAWFDGSPRPGDIGPAVIEGHVDSAANGPSVFYRLGDLVVGDQVEVTREDGTVVPFEVYDVRVVPKADFPTFDVYGNTDGPELRLITCGGPFDGAAGSYLDNVVVFAGQMT
jgi:LPXTG-site transpeptidase (sortase) family protein